MYNILFYILEVIMPWLTYNFAVTFYECQTWSLTMKQECRPRAFEGAQVS